MGWTFEIRPSRLKDFLASRVTGWSNTDEATGRRSQAVCLAHKYSMSNPGAGTLWKVMETTVFAADGAVEKCERWIAIDLIRWGGGKEHGWGYKDVEASMGVYELSCPLKYLEMVPEPGECTKQPACSQNVYGPDGCKCTGCHGCGRCWERRWRSQVRAKAERQQRARKLVKDLRPGDTVVLLKGWKPAELRVEGVYGRKLQSSAGTVPIRAIDVEATLQRRGL